MPTIPIRGLGKIGVITDVNPYDLPLEALSDARNVRFSNDRITNAHVWREAIGSPSGGTPVFAFSATKSGDFDILGYVTKDGKVFHVTNGSATEVSISGHVPANSTATRTFCTLQGALYVNQEDRVPWYIAGSMTDYATLTNWDSNHRCKVLRGFKDFLIALNVAKSGTTYRNMVKWSNIALYGAVPDSWDPADTTKSAGENTLGEIQTDILDGMALRNAFVIYADDQAWIMEFTQGPEVFSFYKAFGDRGIVNTNCVAEVDGAHLVFDEDDIYMHDGVSPPQSICDRRTRKRIFRFMDLTKRTVFFTYHSQATSEVWFCYNTTNPGVKWSGDYCNEAAVYNYSSDSWTFFDLPNVSGIADINWSTAPTYDTVTYTYDTIGSTYLDLVSNAARSGYAMSVSSGAITATRILNIDNAAAVSLPFPSISELTVLPYATRIGMDLDETGESLRAYKNYRAIYPQVTVNGDTSPFSFKFGGVDFPQQEIEWDSLQEFDAAVDYKLDTRSRGRYLSWYFEGTNANNYTLSGFDLDMVAVSRR